MLRQLTRGAVIAATLMLTSSVEASNVRREVSGWYNDGWNAESHAAYMSNDHIFSATNPYWYDLGSQTNLSEVDGSISERAYAYTAQNVIDAHANGDLVIPAIADHARGQIDSIVKNPTARATLIANIVNTVLNNGYDGIDVNFERGTSAAKVPFTVFVNDLATALHSRGKRLDLTVRASATAKEEGAYIFDYAALGTSGADRLKVMAYDHNFDVGTNVPGPIAGIPWIRSALSYILTTRRVPASKVVLGVHEHGWTWLKVSTGWQLVPMAETYASVTQKAGTTGWQWDSTAKEAWKQYSYGGRTYKSYVGTAASVSARLALVDEFNLAGVAFWSLGRDDAAIYPAMCTYFGSSCGTPSVHPVLLSQGKPTTSSSSYDSYYTASKAVDGTLNEGWLADPTESISSLAVDLQSVHTITKVQIYWGKYDWSGTYDVQTSTDGINWTTAYHEANNSDGGLDEIALSQVSGRYVRVVCTGPKADNWSYEIYELKVEGMP